MQHDTVIWDIISPSNGGFCSFRRKLPNCPTKFCKNQYNVLGICHPLACPLANSRYATIREHKGECYLLMKTIERAHCPSRQWEKIKLSQDYMTALKQIDEHLIWWPTWNIHKCKLRLTRIHQYLIRARKLALSIKPKLVRIWKPYERQQQIRERKAEIASKVTNVIKAELLQRLHEGVYEGIYNFPLKPYNEILEEKGIPEDSEEEQEKDQEELEEEEEKGEEKEEEKEKEKEKKNKNKKKEQTNDDDNAIPEFVEDFEDSDYGDVQIEDIIHQKNENGMEKEYEFEYVFEDANDQQTAIQSNTQHTNHGQFIKNLNDKSANILGKRENLDDTTSFSNKRRKIKIDYE